MSIEKSTRGIKDFLQRNDGLIKDIMSTGKDAIAALKGLAARVTARTARCRNSSTRLTLPNLWLRARTRRNKNNKNSLPPTSRRSSRPSRETLMTAVSERDSKCALAPVRMQGKILFVLPKLTKKNDSRGRAGRANR